MTSRSPSSSPDPIVLPSSPPSAHLQHRDGLSSALRQRTVTPAGRLRSITPAIRQSESPAIFLNGSPATRTRSARRALRASRLASTDAVNEQLAPNSTQRPFKRARLSREPPAASLRQKQPHILDRSPSIALDPELLALSQPVKTSAMVPQSQSPARTRRSRTAVSAKSPSNWPDVLSPVQQSRNMEAPGDHTMANEDFTMISGDSLASIKANNSIFGNSQHVDHTQPEMQKIPDKQDVQYPKLDNHNRTPIVYTPAPRTATIESKQSSNDPQIVDDGNDGDSNEQVFNQDGVSDDSDAVDDAEADTHHENNAVDDAEADILQEHDVVADVGGDAGDDAEMLDADEDIWAIEASRSIDHGVVTSTKRTGTIVPPVFSDDVQPPRRSKLPGTWRRRSGEDFAYSDSPAHAEYLANRAAKDIQTKSAISNISNVLSPPATDEDKRPLHSHALTAPATQEAETFDLTEPDAAATQLQDEEARHLALQQMQSPATSGESDNQQSEDSGIYWHNNRSSKVNTPKKLDQSDARRPRYYNRSAAKKVTNDVRQQVAEGAESVADEFSDINDHLITSTNTNVKHSRLLSQSPIRPRKTNREAARPQSRSGELQNLRQPRSRSIPVSRVEVLRPRTSERHGDRQVNQAQHDTDPDEADETSEDSVSDEDDGEEPSKSYEEHLNVYSPGKVKIRFDESTQSEDHHNVLKPSRAYPSLFGDAQSAQHTATSTLQAIDAGRPDNLPAAQNILSRMTNSLWSAIIRPKGPAYIDPPQHDTSGELLPPLSPEPVFPIALRAKLRSRYGIVAKQHPWTMLHMRTLHRMLNSLIQHPSETIVPTKLPLPRHLAAYVNTMQYSATAMPFTFRYTHACVVNTFLQVMVPLSLVKSMERGEVEWLGDDITESYRGIFGERAGSELCFQTVETPDGEIDVEWLIACIGCVLFANRETKKREEQAA